MNKTVAANISGIIFNIEELAYEKLGQYLNTIKGYFKNSEGGDEIMIDIEARIAELFQERVSDNKQVITLADVEEVIAIMGQPEEYLDEEATEQQDSSNRNKEAHSTTSSGESKQIFRDPDSNILGGVCSGVSQYFGFDPLWLRLLFVILFFFFGTGVLLYIILWIIIPEAKTTADKLKMRGEPVNVDNIRKNVKERFEDATDIDTKQATDKAKNAIEQIFDYFKKFITAFFQVFGKLIGVAFIAAGAFAIFILINLFMGNDAIIAVTDHGLQLFSYSEYASLIFASSEQETMALIGIITAVGIPIVSLFLAGIKLLLDIKTNLRMVGIALFVLWIGGLVLCGTVGIQLGKEFTNDAEVTEVLAIEQPVGDTLMLDIMDDVHFSNHFRNHHEYFIELTKIERKETHFGFPFLDIREQPSDSVFTIEVRRMSHGRTQKEAINRAENIRYDWNQSDSLLTFSPFFSIDNDEKFRGQHIEIIVRVPEGKAVHLSDRMDRIIYDIGNVTRTRDRRMTGKTWTMTDKGLECIDCDL